MSENLKQGLLTFAAAVMFCIAVSIMVNRVETVFEMLKALETDRIEAVRIEAVREVMYDSADY